jgi:hypothetical protein
VNRANVEKLLMRSAIRVIWFFAENKSAGAPELRDTLEF